MPDYIGFFTPGTTAARWEVGVLLTDSGLELKREDGSLLALWPYGKLDLVDEIFPNLPIRLKSRTDPDARLTLSDHGILEPLLARACGSLLSIYLILFVAFIGAGLVIGAVAASLVMITASIPEDVQDIDLAVAVVPGIAVVFVLIVLGILRQIIVVPRFTRLFCERLTVGGKADFAAIAQSQRPLPSRGEGLADILDMGGI